MACSSASATRCRGLVIKFSPLAMQGKNLLSSRVEFFPFSIYIAYPPGKGYNSLKCLCPMIAYAGCFDWAFLEREYFCQQNIVPVQVRFYPEGRRHVAISSTKKEKKILSCNPNVFIRTSLTFGIPASNTARTSLPAPLLGMGQFLLLLLWKVWWSGSWTLCS